MARKNKSTPESNDRETVTDSSVPSREKSIDKDIFKTVLIVAAAILLFTCGNFIGGIVSPNKNNTVETIYETEADTTQEKIPVIVTDPTTSPITTPETQPIATTQASQNAGTSESLTPEASDTTTQAEAPSGASYNTPAQIIALFNESANKIKANSAKVTRNYEDLQHNEEYTVMPKLVSSLGKSLISRFLKKDETPITYTAEELNEKYPVQQKDYVSKATEADIAEAVCNDDGTYYNITLKFKESVDPDEGTGCASAFNVLSAQVIKDSAGGIVSESSTRYYDAVITCKIEKATGNMVWANYKLPMVLSVKALGVSAAVGMTFEDDYTIEY